MAIRKSYYVRNIFNKISHKYDFLNNLLSFGLHNLWKKKLINLVLITIMKELLQDLFKKNKIYIELASSLLMVLY